MSSRRRGARHPRAGIRGAAAAVLLALSASGAGASGLPLCTELSKAAAARFHDVAAADWDVATRQAFRCGRDAWLRAALDRAEGAAASVDVQTRLRAALLRVRLAVREGRSEQVRERLPPLLAAAAAQPDTRVHAQALLERAALELADRRTDAASVTLDAAAAALSGAPQDDTARLMQARLLRLRGQVHAAAGESEAAVAAWRSALAAAEALARGADAPGVASVADHPAHAPRSVEAADALDLALRLGLDLLTAADDGSAQAAGALAEALASPPPPAADSVDAVSVRLDAAALLAARGRPEVADRALDAARVVAERLDDAYLSALVAGRRAQAHLAAGRAADALAHAENAVQRAQAWPVQRYQWEWTAARARAAQGDGAGALGWYRLAAGTLDELRAAGAAPRAYALSGRLHFELADALLRSLDGDGRPDGEGGEAAQRLMREARDRIERSKAAELRDYFQDDCVAELQQRITPIDRLPARTAVLYPILLEDRLELLLSLPDTIVRHVEPVGREAVGEAARGLRELLVQRTTRRFLRPARELYDRLVGPLRERLDAAGIETLVIVPEGPLRLFPMAALHDGRQFLVERFALASTPGLDLTDAGPLGDAGLAALVGGVTEPRQGFAALAHVDEEVRQISRRTGARLLLDGAFRRSTLADAMLAEPYSVVHLASHAQFDADPDKTFLLTWDGRIGLDGLSELVGAGRYRPRPIELLTLSACETAAGDERSALGLAGAAVRSGARSVVASLWAIDDRASAVLLAHFYDALFDGGAAKAQALSLAQRRLIADRRYAHPAYWSPFLLIGNWQ